MWWGGRGQWWLIAQFSEALEAHGLGGPPPTASRADARSQGRSAGGRPALNCGQSCCQGRHGWAQRRLPTSSAPYAGPVKEGSGAPAPVSPACGASGKVP
ncbi:hypothetical protein SGFS_027480 [Streptomyces graminofaciens]|uniref:Uncharacterized protein n=1 Tax=Streptomyces graminofaciens TaxID=68212 RepID=A0ABM7F6L0_9ACTN|nr:hypothetical protein SGFS_027480 [Streptomyces graminofaciens]